MRTHSRRTRGNAILEFTLIGIPLIFILVSVFEISRGMWIYHTLAHAVKEGARYAVVHGRGCEITPNTCTITVGDIARRISEGGTGLLPAELNITLSSETGSPLPVVDCNPLSSCLDGATSLQPWPQYPSNQPGMDIRITGNYPFRSMIAMFWPGAGQGMTFGAFTLPAGAVETIQF